MGFLRNVVTAFKPMNLAQGIEAARNPPSAAQIEASSPIRRSAPRSPTCSAPGARYGASATASTTGTRWRRSSWRWPAGGGALGGETQLAELLAHRYCWPPADLPSGG